MSEGPPKGWVEGMAAHLDRHLGGDVKTLTEIAPAGIQMDLFVHAPSRGRRFQTVVTSGLSWRPMAALEGEATRAELMLYLPPSWDLASPGQWWPGKALRQLGRLVHDGDTWFGVGHTLQNEDPPQPYVEGSCLSHCVLLEPPESKLFGRLTLPDADSKRQRVTFLWVFFLTQDECDEVREAGSPKPLLKAFGRRGPPRALDPTRESALRAKGRLKRA